MAPSVKSFLHDPRQESIVDFWLYIIVNTTILAFLINILSLWWGTGDVAAHLMYIPIVIAAYWYPNRGMIYAFGVSAAYLLMIAVMAGGVPLQIVGALIRCIVFVGVAAVVSSLAIHMQKSEMKYRGIFDNSEAGTGLVNRRDLAIVDANPRFARALGYSPEGADRISFSSIWVEPAERERFFATLDATGRVTTMETRLTGKDSQIRWVLLSAGSLPDDQFVCALVDITGRKKAEESLIIRDQAIRSSINAVAMFDTSFKITFFNQSLLRTMGSFEEKDFMGRNWEDFFDDGAKFSLVKHALMEKGSWLGELVLKKTDNTPFYAMLWANTVRDNAGTPICIMASFLDITERKQMEMAQRRALEQIEKNIEQFAILGDHIRNPLTVIVGLASITADDITERIIAQAKEIDRIVTQLDKGWIESEKVRDFIRRYYNVGSTEIETYPATVAAGGDDDLTAR